ncbi:four-carbon acid sugar kinase family protein [Chachezhania sediminis]|uniref:four-carbon acid sugar kinase family protein n=1 Tax=Chachezhania sediminis TaxID=2599291 RepID=UPI00131BD60D|nr:four-carbon acid sugar kinase family protein [Chachezhania sediminis]
MPPELGILSDDFTGGLLVASLIEADGVACPVYFSTPAAATGSVTAPVIVIAARTRLVPVAQALDDAGAAFGALDDLGCRQVAYKACGTFDSTEEGNIGPVARLLSERYGQSPVLMSAGFPEARVAVFEGHMFVGSDLINESSKRFDPVTPMADPNLVRFLSLQTGSPVGLVRHRELLQGAEAASRALQQLVDDGHEYILLDAADVGDIAVSADLVAGHRSFVASDSLIVAVGRRAGRDRKTAPAPVQHAEGPIAVLAGSVGPIAEDQLAAFEAAHPICRIDPAADGDPEALAERAVTEAAAHIGRPFAVTTCTDRAGVEAAQAKFGQMGAARRAEAILAGVAGRLYDRGVRRFVVSGGETSGAVVGALKIDKVRALPFGPLGGGFCIAEAPSRISLFLKSGKLGDRDVLLRALDEMEP